MLGHRKAVALRADSAFLCAEKEDALLLSAQVHSPCGPLSFEDVEEEEVRRRCCCWWRSDLSVYAYDVYTELYFQPNEWLSPMMGK